LVKAGGLIHLEASADKELCSSSSVPAGVAAVFLAPKDGARLFASFFDELLSSLRLFGFNWGVFHWIAVCGLICTGAVAVSVGVDCGFKLFRFFVVVECIDQVAPFWVCGMSFLTAWACPVCEARWGFWIVSSSLLLSHFFAFGPFGANDDPSWVLTDGDVAVRFVLVQTIVGVVECNG
jgi:hypothetical protein